MEWTKGRRQLLGLLLHDIVLEWIHSHILEVEVLHGIGIKENNQETISENL